MEHTPGEWKCFYKRKYNEWHVSMPIAGSSMRLALCENGIPGENPEATANRIVRAVNCFNEMLAALMAVYPNLGATANKEISDKVKAAIARAKGGQP